MSRDSKDSEYTPWKESPPKRWKNLFKVMMLSLALLIAGVGIIVMFLDMNSLRQSLAKILSKAVRLAFSIFCANSVLRNPISIANLSRSPAAAGL